MNDTHVVLDPSSSGGFSDFKMHFWGFGVPGLCRETGRLQPFELIFKNNLDASFLLTIDVFLLTGSSFLLTVGEPQAEKTKPKFRTGGTVSR